MLRCVNRCEAVRSLKITRNGLAIVIRMALLLAGLFTYFVSPDDVVWQFIKTSANARLLEHGIFGVAAAVLGIALLLKMKISVDAKQQDTGHTSHARAVVASLLQAIGIGSLLPLPGFLLLVFGDLGVSTLLYRQHPIAEEPQIKLSSRTVRGTHQAFRWRDSLVTHMGLCCAFISMVLFSITLIDRIADVLFAISALVSIAVISRHALPAKSAKAI